MIAYENGRLHVDGVDVDALADAHGSPLWVYSQALIEERYARIANAFQGLDFGIRYAIKANSNAAILRVLRSCGAGFDLVSGGEYRRARRIGAEPGELVFAGVGKQDWEIELAVREGVGFYHIESEPEFDRLSAIAKSCGETVRVALRLNPDVPVDTHDYIKTGDKESKFGVDFGVAARIVERLAADEYCKLSAYHVHLGSLLFDPEPYFEACSKVLDWMARDPKRREGVTHYDMGGGFGSRGPFSDEAIDLDVLAAGMKKLLEPRGLALLCEPGRFLIGDAGILVSTLLYEKCGSARDFYVVDAAMNDLIRPTLYKAHHDIRPVVSRETARSRAVDVVGPVCEGGDWLGKDRELPVMSAGDRVAIYQAGAYGISMASNYNSRPRAPELLCGAGQARLIAKRQELEELWSNECDQVV